MMVLGLFFWAKKGFELAGFDEEDQKLMVLINLDFDIF